MLHFIVLVPFWLVVLWIILQIIFAIALIQLFLMLLPYLLIGAAIWFMFWLFKDDDKDSLRVSRRPRIYEVERSVPRCHLNSPSAPKTANLFV